MNRIIRRWVRRGSGGSGGKGNKVKLKAWKLYDYIFGGLLGAELTQKQNVIFRYLARLMLAIPDAIILTLKDVMRVLGRYPGARAEYGHHA
jgi:hypothetical protein